MLRSKAGVAEHLAANKSGARNLLGLNASFILDYSTYLGQVVGWYKGRRKRQVCWRNRRRNHQPLRSRRWCSPDAYRLDTVGFSCAPAGFGQPSILPFKLLLFGRGGTDESGGPALFEPSLQVERDIGHIKPLHFALVHSGSTDLQLRLDDCIDLRQALVSVRSLPVEIGLGKQTEVCP